MKPELSSLILAAGASARMGSPKALLPLGDETVIQHIITIYRSAGVRDIRVVTGYHQEEIQPILRSLQVREIYNPRYQNGMYSSVQSGISSYDQDISGFFIHPVDVPLIEPMTVRLMSSYPKQTGDTIICPMYQNRRGHPLIVGSSYRTAILDNTYPTGLRGFLYEYSYAIIHVMVDDPGVLLNMNTPADYQEVLTRLCIPSSEKRGIHEDR